MTSINLTQTNCIADLVNQSFITLQHANLDYGHGFLTAYDEAVFCVLHTLNLPLHDLDGVKNQILSFEQIQSISNLVERRATTNQPLAYLVKQGYMHGLSFYVDERVLVPRSFIGEVFVEHMLDDWFEELLDAHNQEKQQALNVLELCTGSACLPILFKHHYTNAFKQLNLNIDIKIDATDICPKALEVAKINVHHYNYTNDIKLHEGSLFANIKPNQQYDLIFSNPPYVCAQSMQSLPKAYLYEPQIALAGGLDGMDLVRQILSQAKNYLKPNGILLIEIGNEYHYAMTMFDELNINGVCWLGVSAGHKQVFLLQAWQIKHLI